MQIIIFFISLIFSTQKQPKKLKYIYKVSKKNQEIFK